MKNSILFIVLIIGNISFANAQFKITGEIEGAPEKSTILIQVNNITIDSTLLVNKKFELKGNLENVPADVLLLVKNDSLFQYASLYIGNENVEMKAHLHDFPFDIKLKGSAYDNERYMYAQLDKPLQIERKVLLNKMWALQNKNQWNDSLQAAYWSRKEPLGLITKIDNQSDLLRLEFIKKNINSYFGLSLLESAKTQINSKLIEDLLNQLEPEFSKTVYFKSIQSHLYNPDLKIGDSYYNFTAYDQNQRSVKFSHYFNGKYVLLDFSTIYCGFCMAAIPALEKMKKEYGDHLEIITFYVDQNIKGFDGLAKKHSPNWAILWDKEGRFSETYAKYKIYGTPTFYLFDPNGKLVKMIDGYSSELIQKVAESIIAK